VTVQGLTEDTAKMAADLRDLVIAAVQELPPRERRDDEGLREAVRVTIRRALKALHGKRPVMDVHVVRI
jgi:ribonuclease J